MGILYCYINDTKRELIVLHKLRPGGGDKENAALGCGAALAALLLPRGRWHGDRIRIGHDEPYDLIAAGRLEADGLHRYADVSAEVLRWLREEHADFPGWFGAPPC